MFDLLMLAVHQLPYRSRPNCKPS